MPGQTPDPDDIEAQYNQLKQLQKTAKASRKVSVRKGIFIVCILAILFGIALLIALNMPR